MSAKQLWVLLLIGVMGPTASVGSRESDIRPVTIIAEPGALKKAGPIGTQIGHQDDATPLCLIQGPKGPWGEYREKDLPSGACSAPLTCALWTREACRGTEYPGPAIKWKCVCASGMWRCDELERTKTACIEPHHVAKPHSTAAPFG
jgi:hypothetical protein